MKNLKLFFSPFILACVVSCQQKQTDLKVQIDKFADLECRAIGLREKRFALADQIRFTEDSLFQATNKADTSTLHLKLEKYDAEKEIMLQQSLSLADTIKNELNELLKNQLSNQKDKALFNDLLNKALMEKGCIKKS